MNASYWSIMLPLVRPLLVKVGVAFAVVILCIAAAWGLEQWQSPDWKSAQARMQSAQSSVNQANTDLADIERLRGEFARHSQSGLVGGAPRAGWIEDLQRIAAGIGLTPYLTYTLASPVNVKLGAEGVGRVTRHELSVSLVSVHEIEGMRLVQQFLQLYPNTARLKTCEFTSPADAGLTLNCKVNLLHIDTGPAPAAGAAR